LKGVEDIDRTLESFRVNRSEGVSGMVLDHLQNARAGKSFQGLGRWMLITALCLVQRITHGIVHIFGKGSMILLALPDPVKWPQFYQAVSIAI
jgi:hypothetical protein